MSKKTNIVDKPCYNCSNTKLVISFSSENKLIVESCYCYRESYRVADDHQNAQDMLRSALIELLKQNEPKMLDRIEALEYEIRILKGHDPNDD